MKTSINAWSVKGDTGFAEMFAQISAAGFDGIELNIDAPGTAHGLSMETTDGDLAEIKKLSDAYNLPVVSISTSQTAGMWGSPDPAVREKVKALVRKQIYCAEALGATGILTVPGGMNDNLSLLASWKNSVTAMKEFGAEIKGCKIKVGLENVWNAFFTSPFDMVHFLDELDCPEYAIYYDAGNMHAFSSSEHWVEVLSGRIDKVHVKGYKRNHGSINQGGIWCDITDADIRWDKVVPGLKAGGFDGYLTAEVGKVIADQSWDEYYKMVRDQVAAICAYAN
ncbi:MAG: sugar phosphate isomerase/epimerase [Clostridia bacterium]|nr:sugar phosphate isomerase/epimerase [Clostridia bacterium]